MRLSALGAGCWSFGGGEYWGEQSQKDVNDIVHRAVELGINYFDTAEAYNDGRSEQSLGEAIKGLSREKLVIGTKVSPDNTYPDTLVEHCEASLKRLNTDYIDLYMVHWPIHSHSIRHFKKDEHVINNPPKVKDAFDGLKKLQERGKILYIGVSNFGVERFKQAQNCGVQIVINEMPYSLLTRAIEFEILPYCVENGVGIIGYVTLLQGLLADIYPTLDDVPAWQRRTRHFNCRSCELCRHGEDGAEEQTNQALADIRIIAKRCGLTMPQIAVKWALSNKAISCALVGARDIEELEDNVRAASQPLDHRIVEKLYIATRPLLEKLGSSFDYYESKACDRTK